jgi:putative MATE family efflux protein
MTSTKAVGIPSYREILNVATPLIFGGISESISAVVDTMFMGSLGKEAIDSVGFTSIILLLVMMIGWGISRAVQVILSQLYGANKWDQVGVIIRHGLMIMIPISLFISSIVYFFASDISNFMFSNKAISVMSEKLFKIRSLGFGFVMITALISSFFIAVHQTKIILIVQIIAAISNVILNYLFVFGKFGFQPMGYSGSAYATVIAEFIGFVVILSYFFYKKHKYDSDFKIFSWSPFDKKVSFQIILLSYPIWLQHILSLGCWIYFFALIERMSIQALAVSIILKQIFSLVAIPSFALANTSNTFIGQLVGARKINSILPTIYKISFLGSMILLIFTTILFIFKPYVFRLFTQDTSILEISFWPYMMLLISFLILPIANIFFHSILGLGNSKINLIIETITILFYFAYIHLILETFKLNIVWAWTSEIFYWVVLLFTGLIFFKWIPWQRFIKYH